jgi:hypothetical protein
VPKNSFSGIASIDVISIDKFSKAMEPKETAGDEGNEKEIVM